MSTISISKLLFIAIICGFVTALATGLVENPPEASIIGAKYYGYPLAWRIIIVSLITSVDFWFVNLAIDILFWSFFSFLVLILTKKVILPKLGAQIDFGKLVLPFILFIPLGLVMDFAHEFGHAAWGISAGGSLNYMQIAFLVIYPSFAITPIFRLGYVEVIGLSTTFSHGIFLLGGSLTTTIVSWLIAFLQWKKRFGDKTQVALKILGIFGLLDLPLYVVLPQIGLQHWIFIGGNSPEPLNGAREIGVPDYIFFAMVFLSTLGLILLYSRPLQQILRNKIKELTNYVQSKGD